MLKASVTARGLKVRNPLGKSIHLFTSFTSNKERIHASVTFYKQFNRH